MIGLSGMAWHSDELCETIMRQGSLCSGSEWRLWQGIVRSDILLLPFFLFAYDHVTCWLCRCSEEAKAAYVVK